MNGMDSLNNTVGAAMNAYATQETATHNTSGKTIGQPKLSEKAQKYYDELKSKYQNLDFVLVSKDMKEMAKANAASFANPNKMVVLIDEEKIERMAEDEQFRKKYEGIIASAGTKLPELGQAIGNTSGVKGFGMQVNDDGSVDYFAVIDKSMAAQRERIKANAEKKAEAKKEAKKEAAKDAKEAALEEAIANRKAEKDGHKVNTEDTVMVKAASIEELIQKINDVVYNSMSDYVQTEAELKVGQNFDFSI